MDRFNKPADQDSDLIPDCVDPDRDGDGYDNTQDVFPDNDREWVDTDGDGLGDNFEVDDDNDGYLDTNDAFPLDPNEWADADNDGIGDNADPDIGNDGFPDEELVVSGVLTPNSMAQNVLGRSLILSSILSIEWLFLIKTEFLYLALATTKTTGQVPLKTVHSQLDLTTMLLKKAMEKWQKRDGCISPIKSLRFL